MTHITFAHKIWLLVGATGNVASLPDNHLAAGQSAMKLRDDLYAAKNSADLLAEMLAPISIHDPADVKQVHTLFSLAPEP